MTRQTLIISTFILLTFFSCSNENSGTQKTNQDTTTTSTKKTEKKTGIIWESEFVKIYGDSSIDQSKIYYTERKFEPYLAFSDFPTKLYLKGKPAEINYNSNRTAKRFKTVITDTYNDKKAEFAGTYVFARWGCGTSCQQSAIIDLRDGTVYDGPTASLGYQYKVDSRLLIVNPPDSTGFIADCPYCLPEFWIWNEELKKFEKRE
jgi:hypothetical protein